MLEQIGVPLEALQPSSIPSLADVIHLPTSTREQIRTSRGLKIPAERTINKCKKKLAATHATGTGTFAHGALTYIQGNQQKFNTQHRLALACVNFSVCFLCIISLAFGLREALLQRALCGLFVSIS